MKYIVIENTGITVSRLTFGTASLHHIYNSSKRQRLLEVVADAGITHFDTAPYYGYGLAETDLGNFLKKKRHKFTLSTKIGLYPRWGASNHAISVWIRKAIGKFIPTISSPVANWEAKQARASLHCSLRRLKSDYIDFLFLHEPDINQINLNEFFQWVMSEHERGTVRACGVAGLGECVIPFLENNNPLAKVVQTLDSLDKRQADFMLNYGRNFQFTYGYLSRFRDGRLLESPKMLIQKALQRNQTGAVIISSRSPEHFMELAGSNT
jgi:aryl-alcohol dehydrogenase-like predicted oxidoreductase